MVQYFKSLSLALLLSVGGVTVAKAASFDCNKANTETEIAICSDPELGALDELMAQLFSSIKQDTLYFPTLLLDQIDWLAARSATDYNLTGGYIQRIAILSLYRDYVSDCLIDDPWAPAQNFSDCPSHGLDSPVENCVAEQITDIGFRRSVYNCYGYMEHVWSLILTSTQSAVFDLYDGIASNKEMIALKDTQRAWINMMNINKTFRENIPSQLSPNIHWKTSNELSAYRYLELREILEVKGERAE